MTSRQVGGLGPNLSFRETGSRMLAPGAGGGSLVHFGQGVILERRKVLEMAVVRAAQKYVCTLHN